MATPQKGLLQPVAPGLLSLLGLKQRGQNPDTLGDTVVPTLDLTHWYHADQPEVRQGSVLLASGVGYADPLVFTAGELNSPVPDGEIWWVRDFTVYLGVNTATVAVVQIYGLSSLMSLREQSPSAAGSGYKNGPSAPPFDSVVTGVLPQGGGIFFAPSMSGFWATAGSYLLPHFVGQVTDAMNSPNIIGLATIDRFLV